MDDRERWDQKYRGALGRSEEPPDAFVLEALARLPEPGEGELSALDLAAGTGRHAFELARRGWRTCAWDVSPVGLGILAERAARQGLAVETRALDLLTRAPAPRTAFDLVVCVLFLDRGLLPRLCEWVRPGGHLIFTTVTADWPHPKPPERFRLERGELARGLPGFETVHASEEGGRAGLFARRSRS